MAAERRPRKSSTPRALGPDVSRAAPPTGYTARHRDAGGERRRAVCTCGWAGPWRTDPAEARADEDAHGEEMGHGPLHLDAPADSPYGRVGRALATSIRPEGALDRLRAIRELRRWLDDEEIQAVIGARLARCTWAEMGAAWGTTRQGAFNRWGEQVKRYEGAGLLLPDAVPGPAEGGRRS